MGNIEACPLQTALLLERVCHAYYNASLPFSWDPRTESRSTVGERWAVGTNVIHGVRTQEELSCSRRFWVHSHLAALALLSLWRLSWIRHTIYLAGCAVWSWGAGTAHAYLCVLCHVTWSGSGKLSLLLQALNFLLSWHLIGRLFFMSHRRIAHVFSIACPFLMFVATKLFVVTTKRIAANKLEKVQSHLKHLNNLPIPQFWKNCSCGHGSEIHFLSILYLIFKIKC